MHDHPLVIDDRYIETLRDFSRHTFGPSTRLKGVLDHLRKELVEVEANPTDVFEWVDIIILALDGAWRQGIEPQDIIDALWVKLDKNMRREWPDWREGSEDEAIEHIRGGEHD